MHSGTDPVVHYRPIKTKSAQRNRPRCALFLHHTPMQLVVPSVVRIAVMILAMTCKSVFHPSFFIAFSIFNG